MGKRFRQAKAQSDLLKLLDDLGSADNTIVQYSTNNGLHYNTWPDAGATPFRSEKKLNWEGAYCLPCFIKWPGKFPAGEVRNGIVSHEDWLPTFAAAAVNPDIVEQLKKGVKLNGRSYKNYLDGASQLDYISGKTEVSPLKCFMYVNDDGKIIAMRYEAWKAVFLENRGQAFEVWREPFTELRVPMLATPRVFLDDTAGDRAATQPLKILDSFFVDDKEGKPVGIHQMIGRSPVMCFGNSDGDKAMLEYTTVGNPRPSFGLIVHHTDEAREYVYDAHPQSSGKPSKL